MRHRLFCCCLLVTASLSVSATQARAGTLADAQTAGRPPALRVMTYNIRYNNPGDGPNAWPHRKELVASMIRFHSADLVGVQEALRGQIDDLAELLPEFAWQGVGRDDGKDKGEFSAIFYRKDRLKLLKGGTFWLSETPDVAGSKGWDAALPRIVTWARFRDRATDETFYHFNTHFDHQGRQARAESARLLLARVEEMARSAPALVTGDFNADLASEPYRILTAGELHDAKDLSLHGHHGPSASFNGFRALGTGTKIDHIFVRGDVRVLQHGILSDTFDGRFPSDHCPVLAEVVVE